MAVIVEGTTCHDVTDIEEPNFATRLGAGPALSIMDSASYYDKRIINRIVETATKEKIAYQFRQTTMGGTDAGKIHLTREGIPCAGIAVPCRYIHSPVSVMSKNDFDGCSKLVKAFLESIREEEFIHG